jgi:hypothetical protein
LTDGTAKHQITLKALEFLKGIKAIAILAERRYEADYIVDAAHTLGDENEG